ncbi:MAG: hypothetical protein IIU57_00555, partial [Oscillospiraceae bacterium]|nr:hypothetical protein [Oscillospiraceae bacterium]
VGEKQKKKTPSEEILDMIIDNIPKRVKNIFDKLWRQNFAAPFVFRNFPVKILLFSRFCLF